MLLYLFYFLFADESVKWFEMWTEWNLKILLRLDLCTQVHRSKSGISHEHNNSNAHSITFKISIFDTKCIFFMISETMIRFLV